MTPEHDSLPLPSGAPAPPESGRAFSTSSAETLLPLIATAVVLFILFVVRVVVLGGVVPPALLNPAWQLRLVGLLASWGFLPLLGLGLLQVSILIANGAGRPQRRLQETYTGLRRAAVLATFGFLLTLPLQAGAAWKLIHSGMQDLDAQDSPGRAAPQARLDAMEKAIRDAPDARSIQNSLTILRGPAIAPQDMQRPLPQLKQILLRALAEARQNLTGVSREERNLRVWTLLQDCLGNSLTAMAYAFGFAAFAQSPKQHRSLLQALLEKMNSKQNNSQNLALKLKREKDEQEKRRLRDLERYGRDQQKRKRQALEGIEREKHNRQRQ